MTTQSKILKSLKENGFYVSKDCGQLFISQYTPAGEDWGFYLEKLEDIYSYAEYFDPEYEFEMWVEAKRNGFRGVPSYFELWEDQLWKKETLKNI